MTSSLLTWRDMCDATCVLVHLRLWSGRTARQRETSRCASGTLSTPGPKSAPWACKGEARHYRGRRLADGGPSRLSSSFSTAVACRVHELCLTQAFLASCLTGCLQEGCSANNETYKTLTHKNSAQRHGLRMKDPCARTSDLYLDRTIIEQLIPHRLTLVSFTGTTSEAALPYSEQSSYTEE
jgi:hypothetical protein